MGVLSAMAWFRQLSVTPQGEWNLSETILRIVAELPICQSLSVRRKDRCANAAICKVVDRDSIVLPGLGLDQLDLYCHTGGRSHEYHVSPAGYVSKIEGAILF